MSRNEGTSGVSGSGRVRRAEDIVAAVLYFLFKKDVPRFEASPVAIHPVFFESRTTHSEMFMPFAFDRRDYFPFSDAIENSLDALQLAGYLQRSNPKGVFFEIQPSIEALFDEMQGDFPPEEIAVLEQLAQQLADKVKTESRPGVT